MKTANQSGKEKSRMELTSQLWMKYFNEYLFQNGLITEKERNHMIIQIGTRF